MKKRIKSTAAQESSQAKSPHIDAIRLNLGNDSFKMVRRLAHLSEKKAAGKEIRKSSHL